MDLDPMCLEVPLISLFQWGQHPSASLNSFINYERGFGVSHLEELRRWCAAEDARKRERESEVQSRLSGNGQGR